MSDEDEVKTEITQEMIDYIDVRAPEIDPWAWYDLYGEVLEYLDEYEEGKRLSKKKIAAVIDCFNDLQTWQGYSFESEPSDSKKDELGDDSTNLVSPKDS